MLDLPPLFEAQLPPAIERQIEKEPEQIKVASLLATIVASADSRLLSVGPGKKYQTLSQAVKASKSGDRIELAEGTYLDTFVQTRHALTIVGLGQGAILQSDILIPNDKAVMDKNTSPQFLPDTSDLFEIWNASRK